MYNLFHHKITMFCILIYLDIGRTEKESFYDFFPGGFLAQKGVFVLFFFTSSVKKLFGIFRNFLENVQI